jgi:predicted DNA-binding transcriptional regulator AlpA
MRPKAIEKPEQPEYIRAKEVARRLKVSLPTVWNWSRQGILHPIKLGTKITVYLAADVDRLYRPREDTAAKPAAMPPAQDLAATIRILACVEAICRDLGIKP